MKSFAICSTVLALLACAPAGAPNEEVFDGSNAIYVTVEDRLRELEDKSGGTLAVILVSGPPGFERPAISYNADVPMAFCSSFKVALAGAAFKAAEENTIDLDAPVTFREDDFPGYQPVMQTKIVAGVGRTTLREAIDATVTTSDNMAANLLIDALGGPASVTDYWRKWGDATSRLDRRETQLNENAPDDLRDTATAASLVNTMRLLVDGQILSNRDAAHLKQLMATSTTGLDRVRAGLADDLVAGDKTGTCQPPGQPNQQVNDIGWITGRNGEPYWFAVLLQRPTLNAAGAKAIHAQVGEIFSEYVSTHTID